MRKKILIVLMACALSAGVMTGCGDSKAKESTKTEGTDKVSKTKKDDSKEVSETDYTAWTGKEWNAANDNEKTEVAKYYLLETTRRTAEAVGTELTAEMESQVTTDDAVNTAISALDMAFSADENISMSDMLQAATAAAEGMIEGGE